MSNWRIFTDGACSGNPGPGGWAAVLRSPTGKITELGGFDSETTNNRMEMMAVIEGLRFIHPNLEMQKASFIEICLDSKYVKDGATQYLARWAQNGFLTQQGQAVKNQDLWLQIKVLLNAKRIPLSWIYVPGHSGVPGNERADQIAREYSMRLTPVLFTDHPETDYSWDLNEITANTSEKSGYPCYLSCIEDQVLEHQTWDECRTLVLGKAGAKFKKVKNKTEKMIVLKGWGFNG